MEVLCIGYVVPFHHLPLVSQELVEFLSYGLGSVKVQALQAKEDKPLKKGTLEVLIFLVWRTTAAYSKFRR